MCKIDTGTCRCLRKKNTFQICPRLPLCPMWPPYPMLHQGFLAQRLKMVSGHNLHHMAPFRILEAGFCMVFRRASFWLLVPGTKIWTQDLEIGLQPARGGFGKDIWGWKNTVLWRNGFENGDWGTSRDRNGLYGTQEAFGKASFPQNPLKK